MSLINHIVYFICSSVASLIYKILIFFLAAVWGCLGAHQHCIWHIREYQSGGWEWCCAHLCQAPQLPQRGCPRAGMNRYCLLSGTYMWWCLCCCFLFVFQAVWALGNVAGDSPKCRDLVLGHGGLFPLLQQLNEHAKLSMLRNATWTLSNFCRGKPQPNFDQVNLGWCFFWFCWPMFDYLNDLDLFVCTWVGQTSSVSTAASHPLSGWGGPNWCLLGSLIPLWWN